MGAPVLVVYGLAVLAALRPVSSDLTPDPVRAQGALAEWAVTSGIRYSPTIARLVRDLRARDVIAYVAVTDARAAHAAETRLLSGVGPTRYLLVTIRAPAGSQAMLELLAHELQHVTEIAERPDVKDEAGLRRLFHEIGEARTAHRFETRGARTTELRVRLELGRYPRWFLGALRPAP